MSKFRLAGVLRARHAQEAVAKAAAARARADAQAAAEDMRRTADALDAVSHQHPNTTVALAAAMSARQALATALCAAIGVTREADEAAAAATDELAIAAAQRKAMEKLAERHAVTRRKQHEAVEARAVDDLVAARHKVATPEAM